jgi:hypothetical protein
MLPVLKGLLPSLLGLPLAVRCLYSKALKKKSLRLKPAQAVTEGQGVQNLPAKGDFTIKTHQKFLASKAISAS